MKASARFIECLHRAEERHTLDPLLELFDDGSTLMRLSFEHTYTGLDGAREFWREYFSVFKQITSRFTHVFDADQTAVLEWESTGVFERGETLRYCGVSVIEFGEERVKSFRTYFDSARFATHVGGGQQTAGASSPRR